jgi:hypothetical protein
VQVGLQDQDPLMALLSSLKRVLLPILLTSCSETMGICCVEHPLLMKSRIIRMDGSILSKSSHCVAIYLLLLLNMVLKFSKALLKLKLLEEVLSVSAKFLHNLFQREYLPFNLNARICLHTI